MLGTTVKREIRKKFWSTERSTEVRTPEAWMDCLLLLLLL